MRDFRDCGNEYVHLLRHRYDYNCWNRDVRHHFALDVRHYLVALHLVQSFALGKIVIERHRSFSRKHGRGRSIQLRGHRALLLDSDMVVLWFCVHNVWNSRSGQTNFRVQRFLFFQTLLQTQNY